MTITNLETLFVEHKENLLKDKNYKYDQNDTLHIISVISNPCNYKRRITLMKDFINRMENHRGLSASTPKTDKSGYELYIVELLYGEQNTYSVTDKNNIRHLQIKTMNPLWHKENMINLGIKQLLPDDWKYVAWIDSDIEFDSKSWIEDTKYKLYHEYDILQLFNIALDLSENNDAMKIYQSFGYKNVESKLYDLDYKPAGDINYWHCGYAWACTREFYDSIGKLYDLDIVGSGDYRMAMAFIGRLCKGYTSGYNKCIIDWYNRIPSNIKLGYISGLIRHYYHGSKINRRYRERNEILREHKYDPLVFLYYDDDILIPTESCPKKFLDDIHKYFIERKEDD